MQLDNKAQMLVEENMGLVHGVIKDNVRDIGSIGMFTYEDLFQIGCVGLCKAAGTVKPGKTKFSTYAYILIRNEIFTALEYATLRKNRESIVDSETLQYFTQEITTDGSVWSELDDVLGSVSKTASGSVARGIMALRLIAEGYSHREIGEKMNAPANHVSAWVAKARKLLKSHPDILSLRSSL